MGLKKPLFLKVDTASVTESQTSSFRPGASVSPSHHRYVLSHAVGRLQSHSHNPLLLSLAMGATSMQASVSLQSFSGDLKLVSSSYQEYKFTEQGLHKTAKQQPGSDAKFYEVTASHLD